MVGFTGPLDEYGPLLLWQICLRKPYKADAESGGGEAPLVSSPPPDAKGFEDVKPSSLHLLHLALHCLAGKAFQLRLSSGFTSLSPVLGRQPQAGTAAITRVPLHP